MRLLLADAILVIHFLFVAFVVMGQAGIVVGWLRGWAWVRCRWFRFAHLAAISLVVLQSWLGMICPLTIWENTLRRASGETGYRESFIEYWLSVLVYYDLPSWVFVAAYTLFGALVAASWFIVKPGIGK